MGTNSFNEPYTNDYYSHTAYDDYPVVGVSWKQAVAFTKWRTQEMNKFLRANNQQASPDFRLPTESEWEYAALGMEELRNANLYRGKKKFPWQGEYTRSLKKKTLGDQLAYYKLGNLLCILEKHSLAYESYIKCIQIEESFAKAHYKIAVLLMSGKVDDKLLST